MIMMRSLEFLRRFQVLLASFSRDRGGVGAIEFAFIAPILLVLYIGAVEVSVAMSVNKKLARASSTVADLITQGDETSPQALTGMVNVAQSVLAPYDPDPVEMVITGIAIDADGKATIAWSWRPSGDGGAAVYEEGDEVKIPKNLLIADTFLVRSELDYHHAMITSFPFTGSTLTGIDMNKTYYLRPRLGDRVDCDDCAES